MESGISQSLLLGKHLRNRGNPTPPWVQKLDQLVISAAYVLPTEDPFFTGPDGLTYMAFHVARTSGVDLLDVKDGINNALHVTAGAVIYPGAGITEWIYSPGDLVSLATCGTSAFQWSGDWGKDPVFEDYADGSMVNIGRPNAEFLSPLAARSLESIMRRVFIAEPALKDRIPSVALARPASRIRPEQASELILNVYPADFESEKAWESFQVLTRRFLPAHLARRLMGFDKEALPPESFYPLVDLITEGGLKPLELSTDL